MSRVGVCRRDAALTVRSRPRKKIKTIYGIIYRQSSTAVVASAGTILIRVAGGRNSWNSSRDKNEHHIRCYRSSVFPEIQCYPSK